MHLQRSASLFLISRGVYGTDPLTGDWKGRLPDCGLQALCWLQELPEQPAEEHATPSRVFPEHGYAVLCQEQGVFRQAFLCGDATGIHHHREGLQLQVQLGNALVLATTEIPPTSAHGFSDGIHERFNRHPFAHSQLEVDGLDQQQRAYPVPVRIWEPGGVGGISRMAMVDDRGELVDGVAQGRFVFMAEDWVCDAVFAAAAADRQWRLYYHLPAGAARHPEFQAVQGEVGDPAPLLRVNALLPTGQAGAWESGTCQFTVVSLQEMTLRRFSVEENAAVHGEGMVAECRGSVAAFITVMQPAGRPCRVEALRVVRAGGEWVLRWRVCTSKGGTDLQARMQSPPSQA
jgi:hypothetical protein